MEVESIIKCLEEYPPPDRMSSDEWEVACRAGALARTIENEFEKARQNTSPGALVSGAAIANAVLESDSAISYTDSLRPENSCLLAGAIIEVVTQKQEHVTDLGQLSGENIAYGVLEKEQATAYNQRFPKGITFRERYAEWLKGPGRDKCLTLLITACDSIYKAGLFNELFDYVRSPAHPQPIYKPNREELITFQAPTRVYELWPDGRVTYRPVIQHIDKPTTDDDQRQTVPDAYRERVTEALLSLDAKRGQRAIVLKQTNEMQKAKEILGRAGLLGRSKKPRKPHLPTS